ncbi:MAG: phosphoribosylformylglycinamidine synthase [Oscillospiraceae bacterium]|jgi:phosphoribosylformylglycinamidine synthase|nr:phosphoribosylformylglycinamidine synthase [Oscillospiraceae bacterium]
MVYRYYTEKKPEFDVKSESLLSVARGFLSVKSITGVRAFVRYDMEGIQPGKDIISGVLSEPPTDIVYESRLPELNSAFLLVAEPLPGQFDQRADSARQCIETSAESAGDVAVKTADVYAFFGELTENDCAALKKYLINPVEAREGDFHLPETLAAAAQELEAVPVLSGFTKMTDGELAELSASLGLAMDLGDAAFVRGYFAESLRRDPTLLELRLLDTYWSDHCRHTTFNTELTVEAIGDPEIQAAFDRYLALRREVYGERAATRPVTLMDVATIGAKVLKKRGFLQNLDVSEEINACSIHIDVRVGNTLEDWLLMFKNETHNHPTEVEPFGGAATCIGGAIRDPLSGRSYVFQAMRVTGSGDPRADIEDTLAGKLPQRVITTTAAKGFSSYGNQIGLSTGLVDEVYDEGYIAKRMEVGAVAGAVPFAEVRREEPQPGDIVLLVGGRTGRDGIGGATGSSKTHSTTALDTMASEVQKGNAPEERKLQLLFSIPGLRRMIKRCNDFGAGGVSVAVGELADGLTIDLSAVPLKYRGLNPVEIAISESQERMAVCIAPTDLAAFTALAESENLESTVIAQVTREPRVVMTYAGSAVCDLPRELLASNGAKKYAGVSIQAPAPKTLEYRLPQSLTDTAAALNVSSRRGLAEMFDCSVGAGTVLAPYSGRYSATPVQAAVNLIPVTTSQAQDYRETDTCSVFSYGFLPEISKQNPYRGAQAAVLVSVAKLVAAGANPDGAYLSFQEYFGKLGTDPARWGKPFAALLGALDAQEALGLAAIGGKDSMSGTFESIDVPPTLISFAIAPGSAGDIISPEFKAAKNAVYLINPGAEPKNAMSVWRQVHTAVKSGKILSAYAVSGGGVAECIIKMSFGNRIGFSAEQGLDLDLHAPLPGAIVAEASEPIAGALLLGYTADTGEIALGGGTAKVTDLLAASENTLAAVFPTGQNKPAPAAPEIPDCGEHIPASAAMLKHKPQALVLSFPGTNSEIDTHSALLRAGLGSRILVVRNQTQQDLAESVKAAASAIRESKVLLLPGGFSAGDEPDGSAKFIAAFLRSPEIADAVHGLLYQNDGLALGICNGFQALVKSGLLPDGRIRGLTGSDPTLAHNDIGRHTARYVYTRVSSVKSPWAILLEPGQVYAVPVSHGEGRFTASPECLAALAANGQLATRYCSADGAVSPDISVNPNGSMWNIEGIYSPDGRVFGKMGHTERSGRFVGKNIHGNKAMPVFESAAAYYKI